MADKISYLTLAAAKAYADIAVEGAGAIKGKNCQIQSIEPIEGGNRVTFAWYDGSDVLMTDTLDVMDGAKGDQGEQGVKGDPGEKGDTGNGIASVEFVISVGLVDTYRINFTDGSEPFLFYVTNGKDGTGVGDMEKSVYDADDTVANAGGIKNYVISNKPNINNDILII